MKKNLPYILILVILAGFFSPVLNAQAQSAEGDGTCYDSFNNPTKDPKRVCDLNKGTLTEKAYTWVPTGGTPPGPPTDRSAGGLTPESKAAANAAANKDTNTNELEKNLPVCIGNGGSLGGCLVVIFYYIFYVVPALLLPIAAKFFDFLLDISLSSFLYNRDFVITAWGIVRDLSNLFFILILLYISIKIILDIGGSEAKKMIAKVVIMALLINFSMFFTKVVIDSANILAQVFYSKMNVEVKNKTTGAIEPIENMAMSDPNLGLQEKPISAALVNSFDPSRLLTNDFFELLKKPARFSKTSALASVAVGAVAGSLVTPILGTLIGGGVGLVGYYIGSSAPTVPPGLMIGIILISGAIMIFAAYTFLVAGLSFLGRLIELWVLIIFSPFAFMSFALPELGKVEYIGWDSWSKKVLSSAFMAPIFMFMMYFIFLLVNANIFRDLVAIKDPAQQGWMETILLLVLPAMLILILLLKATHFAKKGSGVFGEAIIKGAKVVGGLALGAGLGATGFALRGSIGHVAANLAESERLKGWAARSRIGTRALKMTSGLGASSFDTRGIKIAGKDLAGATGLKIGEAQKGGYAKKRADRAKELETFVEKNIDTSDYGKAQLTRGRMSASRADAVIKALKRGGMDDAIADSHKASLMGDGINMGELATVTRYINAGRRDEFADRMEKRPDTFKGTFWSHAKRKSATKRMSANKIRKSAESAAQTAQLQKMMAAMAAGAGTGGAPAAPAAPAGGGAGGGGGVPHP